MLTTLQKSNQTTIHSKGKLPHLGRAFLAAIEQHLNGKKASIERASMEKAEEHDAEAIICFFDSGENDVPEGGIVAKDYIIERDKVTLCITRRRECWHYHYLKIYRNKTSGRNVKWQMTKKSYSVI